MREYEIVYILRSNFTPEEVEAKLARFHEVVTGGGGGEVTAVQQWGKRQLAYPIKKQTNGHYIVAQFNADPAVIADLERVLKLDEDLLRYLIVLSEGELPAPPGETPDERDRKVRRDSDDDDDGEDEGDDEDEDEDEE